MKLHPIVHDIKTTLWCGPAALATISGQPVSACMAAIRKLRWDTKPIKGITNQTLIKAAALLGYRLTPLEMSPTRQVTLAAWTRVNAFTFADKPVIVNITGHYVVVKGRSFNDNHTKTPVSLKKAPHRRARVQRAFTVEPMTPTAPPVMTVYVKPEPLSPPPSGDKSKALRLAKEHNIPVSTEKGSDVIWVYAPAALDSEQRDRHDGDHATYDWEEALRRVTGYIADLKTTRCTDIATS